MLASLCLSAFGYALLDPGRFDDIAVRVKRSGVFGKFYVG